MPLCTLVCPQCKAITEPDWTASKSELAQERNLCGGLVRLLQCSSVLDLRLCGKVAPCRPDVVVKSISVSVIECCFRFVKVKNNGKFFRLLCVLSLCVPGQCYFLLVLYLIIILWIASSLLSDNANWCYWLSICFVSFGCKYIVYKNR